MHRYRAVGENCLYTSKTYTCHICRSNTRTLRKFVTQGFLATMQNVNSGLQARQFNHQLCRLSRRVHPLFSFCRWQCKKIKTNESQACYVSRLIHCLIRFFGVIIRRCTAPCSKHHRGTDRQTGREKGRSRETIKSLCFSLFLEVCHTT